MIIFLFIGLLLGALSVIFALQNVTPITVTFLAWQIEGSLALVLLMTILTGLVVGLLVSLPELIKKSFQISGLRRKNDKLDADLETMKTHARSSAALNAIAAEKAAENQQH
jgi:lipopolysaccharide assembly protein A